MGKKRRAIICGDVFRGGDDEERARVSNGMLALFASKGLKRKKRKKKSRLIGKI